MFKRLRNESGYSLVEVLAAIVILTIAIIPMFTMFDAGLRSASTSGNYDEARSLANSNLEIIKTKSFADVEGMDGNECPVTRTGFPCEVDVEPPPSGDPPGSLTVTIHVEWGASNSYEASGMVVNGSSL